MTSHEVRVLEDGTRVYADGHRYRPKPRAERAYDVRKPDDPRAVRFHTQWFLPLELLDDAARVMPETRPDDQTLEHSAACRCAVCSRPQAAGQWRRRARRERRTSPRQDTTAGKPLPGASD